MCSPSIDFHGAYHSGVAVQTPWRVLTPSLTMQSALNSKTWGVSTVDLSILQEHADRQAEPAVPGRDLQSVQPRQLRDADGGCAVHADGTGIPSPSRITHTATTSRQVQLGLKFF